MAPYPNDRIESIASLGQAGTTSLCPPKRQSQVAEQLDMASMDAERLSKIVSILEERLSNVTRCEPPREVANENDEDLVDIIANNIRNTRYSVVESTKRLTNLVDKLEV